MGNYIRVNQLQLKNLPSSNISFEVEKGEIVAISGPNGAGKTSLLRYLAGLERPDAMGRVMIGGLDPFHSVTHPKIHRMSGYLTENPEESLILGSAVKDVIFGPENVGVEASVIKKRTEGYLKKFGLYAGRGKAYESLSDGQRQKAALISALSRKPEILLLDNPVWGQDLGEGSQLLKWVLQCAKKLGQTVIYTSQNKEEIKMADKVFYLYDGAIQTTPWNPLEVKGEVRIGTEISDGFYVPDFVTRLENGIEIKEYRYSETDAPRVEMRDLSISNGKKRVVDSVSYSFYPGTMYQIVGGSATGKTAICNAISGFSNDHEGDVSVEGLTGMSPQNSDHTIFEETVMLQLMFGLKERWGSKKTAEEYAIDALTKLHLFEGLWDKNPRKLSFGERKMVDIAGILAMQPDVMILDMPFPVLDYENREILLHVLREYAKEHVVIVTGEIADE